MKTLFSYITMTLLAGILLPLASCSDDDQPVGEWDKSYVTLMGADHLRPVPSFTLEHIEGVGIKGTVTYKLLARVQKASDQDIHVALEASATGFSIDKVVASTLSPVIKAGQLVSDTITLEITDWSELANTKDEAKCQLDIRIAGIDHTESTVVSSAYNTVSLKITKQAEKERESVLLTDPTQWLFTFMEGVENASSNSVAGTGGSDVATNGIPFWFTVDFLKVKELTGIKTSHWGPSFCPTKIELFTSEDGTTWTSIGQFETGRNNPQTVMFEEHVITRYLKYQMITVPGRVDITKFHVYSWE